MIEFFNLPLLGGAFLFLTLSLYLFLWVEMKIRARSENRHGPNRISPRGGAQPLADILKILRKIEVSNSDYPKVFALFLMVLFFLPYTFTLLLIKLFVDKNSSPLDIFLLFFLVIFSIVIENLIPFFQKLPEEKIAIKRSQIKNLMAYSVLFLSTATLYVLLGDSTGLQSLIKSPAGPAACVVTFFAALYLSDSPPLGNESLTSGGIRKLIMQLSNRLWTISISLFWALSFFTGGLHSPIDFTVAFVFTALSCFSILCVRVALPASRQEMALNVLTKYFLPFSFCALLIELILVVLT